MNRRVTARGMTLIEALVALALLSMLAMGMLGTFRVAQRSYVQSLRIAQASDEMLSSQRFLRHVIEAAYPIQLKGDAPHYALVGSETVLTLSAPGAAASASSPFYRYRIAVLSRGTALDLAVSWMADDRGSADESLEDASTRHEILLRDIESAQWSYATRLQVDGHETLQWSSNWSEHSRLPALVKLEVRFPASDRRIWPTLIAAPAVTDEAQCEFDVVGQACRSHSG
jgi:general secretion pathway protein J